MSNAPTSTNRHLVLKSSIIAAVLASSGLFALNGQNPRQIDIGESSVLVVGLRLNQYGAVNNLPGWLRLPDRSTAPYGPVTRHADINRFYFRTLLTSRDVERHFRHNLQTSGFQVSTIRPPVSTSGIVSLMTAFDTTTDRSVQLSIRRAGAARSVEVMFSEPARVATKTLSIGS